MQWRGQDFSMREVGGKREQNPYPWGLWEGRRQKNFKGGNKKDQKIALLSL